MAGRTLLYLLLMHLAAGLALKDGGNEAMQIAYLISTVCFVAVLGVELCLRIMNRK